MWSLVVCVVCIHTVHRPPSRLLYTHLLMHGTMCICVYIYMCTINIHFHVSIVTTCVCSKCSYTLLHLYEDVLCISTWLYINTECLGKHLLTHASVWIVCSSACGLYTTYSSLTIDGLCTITITVQTQTTLTLLLYIWTTIYLSITVHTYSIYDPLIQCFCWTRHI